MQTWGGMRSDSMKQTSWGSECPAYYSLEEEWWTKFKNADTWESIKRESLPMPKPGNQEHDLRSPLLGVGRRVCDGGSEVRAEPQLR